MSDAATTWPPHKDVFLADPKQDVDSARVELQDRKGRPVVTSDCSCDNEMGELLYRHFTQASELCAEIDESCVTCGGEPPRLSMKALVTHAQLKELTKKIVALHAERQAKRHPQTG